MPQKVIGQGHFIASPQTEDGTLLLSEVTLAGFLSVEATTTVETTVSQLDSGFIVKTSLKYLEKGALGLKPSITTSGGNSDEPIRLGDGLRYKELMERVSKIESFVNEISYMMKTLVQNSRPPPTNVEIAKEIWTRASMYLQLQKQSADATHNMHMELIKNAIDVRYNDTKVEIKDIKDHLLQTTSTTPTLPKYTKGDARKGDNDNMRKLPPLVKKDQKRPDTSEAKKAKADALEKEKKKDTREA
ncbi:hypothetical protein Hanom_Chr11g01013221 [Helianthus anomalus]